MTTRYEPATPADIIKVTLVALRAGDLLPDAELQVAAANAARLLAEPFDDCRRADALAKRVEWELSRRMKRRWTVR